MNIQFMTIGNNGVPTSERTWKGDIVYRFIPNYDELLKRSSCEEESACIMDAKRMSDEGLLDFTFPIVYTCYDNDGYGKMKWHLYQHPWYMTEDGARKPKDEMIADIAIMNYHHFYD